MDVRLSVTDHRFPAAEVDDQLLDLHPRERAGRCGRPRSGRERLEHAARELLTTDGWKRWIRVRATNGLARYSLRNQWLIALECHRRGITPT